MGDFLPSMSVRTQAPGDGASGHPAQPLARLLDGIPPPGLVLLSILSIQLGAAFAVRLFPLLGPLGLVTLRVAFAACLLLPLARRSIRLTVRTHAIHLLLFGVVIATMNLCFYESLARIPLGITVAVEFLGPMSLAVATSRRPRDFLWIALAVFGVVMLTPEIGAGLDPLGLALAGVAGSGWACFVLLSRRISRSTSGEAGLALGTLVAGVLLLPVALARGALSHLDTSLLGAALAIALLSTALPLSLEFRALKRLSPRAYGVLITLEPAVAAVVGALVLAQPLTAASLFAIACITAAALGVTLSERAGR